MSEIEKEIKLLVKKINKWNNEYFMENSPSVSDRVFDTNLRKLATLEKQYPEFLNDDSPTSKLGSNVLNKFNKVLHSKKMLSLDKAYSKEEIKKFINDVSKHINNFKMMFYIEPKIDGLSISLIYKDGQLHKAVTRGDGDVGEDVTDNVLNVINDIPSVIDYKKNIEIRGEIFVSKSNFNKINKTDNKFSNPRNMASGTLRQLNKYVVAERHLSCFVYEIITPLEHSINDVKESIAFLAKKGFKTIQQNFLSKNLNDIMEFIYNFETTRDFLNFETDGIVIKLNDVSKYKKLGFTSKFPKYSIAYKFDDELVETKLNNINITIGRTGLVIYNAELESVLLKGSVVSAATLHNFNYIHNLGISIGDDVMIKKAGEIIPKVFSLSKKNNNIEYKKILFCPYCNMKLIDNELKTDQFCTNKLCPEINIKKILHFVSKKGMNISGLGESWIRIFWNLKLIKRCPDIYFLKNKVDEIIKIKRIGEKSLNNLIHSINESKSSTLPSLLFALGIYHLGERNCKLIASEIKEFKNLISFDFKKLENVNDIGPITLNSLIEFQEMNENIVDVNTLIIEGINPTYTHVNTSTNFFTNKIFVITGKLQINRYEIIKIIESNNGKVSSKISFKTNFLICGNSAGTKKAKAEKLGINIILEEELVEILKHL